MSVQTASGGGSTPAAPAVFRIKSPRIAVCISGALRTFPVCAESIWSFFGDVDYYGAFWSWDRDTLAPDAPGCFLPFKEVIFPEQPSAFDPVAPGLRLKNPNVRPMYLGMLKSFELLLETVEDISHYDLIFRCRPDLLFQGHVSDFFESMGEQKVYFPDHSQFGGYCDQFAGGRPLLMEPVLSAYRALSAYEGEEVAWSAELIMKYWLGRHNIEVRELPFEFKICRHGFVGLNYHEIPRHSVQHRRWTTNDPSRP